MEEQKIILPIEAYKKSLSKVPSNQLFDSIMKEIEKASNEGRFIVWHPVDNDVVASICGKRLRALGYKVRYDKDVSRLLVAWNFKLG